MIAEAREALGTLNGIGQTLPDPQLLLRPLQAREAIASSSIEGTFVTPQELLAYELEPSEPNSKSEKRADWQEVNNYQRALESGCEMLSQVGFSNHLIRSMHSILMQGVRGVDKSPGEFRRGQVQIGSSGRFIPPPPEHVVALMDQLIQFTKQTDDELDPLIKSFLIHYQFETIHPFSDGNGRVGRALLALMVYHWHRHAHPWLYLSAFFERYKDEYIDNLFKVSTTGNWTEWLTFCLHGTIAQAKDSILRCNLFRSLKERFHSRVTKPSKRTHKLIESLFKKPILTIPSVAAQFNVSYPTAKREIELLVQLGILQEIKFSYPQLYTTPEIMRIAYSDHPSATSSS
ncbi:Fic family protein [Planctomicrobium piriforme]|uniref:Fic family protein n=2 Tax=Planctomicrobium piriforme TaxID=1576369 RepID=A0A1I3LW23_9PLAN|nr:Fic family protein [Planctomicrobium piriforme]